MIGIQLEPAVGLNYVKEVEFLVVKVLEVCIHPPLNFFVDCRLMELFHWGDHRDEVSQHKDAE